MLSEDISSVIHKLITLRDWMRWGASSFSQAELHFGHGTDNAWDEALALVLHAVHLPHDMPPHILDARLTLSERKKIYELFQARVDQRIPVPYLIHRAYFAELEFYVDERVLIPRSPLAELIEKRFTPWLEDEHVHRILDIGTGSGCIAIACALYFDSAEVDAVDISTDALAVAAMNIDRYDLHDRVHLIESDTFNALPPQRYDIIISNPPYVGSQEFANLPREFQHEPRQALYADDQGLACVMMLLQQAIDYLTPHGILVVEVGNSQAALIARFPQIDFVWIEFARGGEGVFLLTAEQLQHYHTQGVFDSYVRFEE